MPSWMMPSLGLMTNDIEALYERLFAAAKRRGLWIEVLGLDYGYPIFLFMPAHFTSAPHLLIAAGTHGEEPAGCWGLLKFLEEAPERLLENVSILPIISPTAIKTGERYDFRGGNAACGYIHFSDPYDMGLSHAGKILRDNFRTLVNAARDGFLTLHEELDESRAYLWYSAPGGRNLAKRLVKALGEQFELLDGDIDGTPVKGGLTPCVCDGTLEDYLGHLGVPLTICIETPGQEDVEARVQAQYRSALEFSRFFPKTGKRSPELLSG